MPKKRYFSLLALAVPLLAQPTYTTITDTIYTPFSGTLFTGTLQVSIPIPTVTIGGASVARWAQTIQIRNGALSVTVVANDTLTQSGTSYVFHFSAVGTPSWDKFCQVRTSVGALKLSEVCGDTPFSPPTGSAAAGGIVTGPWPVLNCPTCEVTGHKAVPNGYASLGPGGQVPLGQIPALPVSRLDASALADGCLSVVSHVISVVPCGGGGGGGGGGATSWAALTNTQWTGLTNTQWTSLGN